MKPGPRERRRLLVTGQVTIHAHHQPFTQDEQQSKLMVFGSLGLALFLAIYRYLLFKKEKPNNSSEPTSLPPALDETKPEGAEAAPR